MRRLLAAALLMMAFGIAQSATIQYADAFTYRQQASGLAGFNELFMAILVPGVEDRGVVEFNVSSIGPAAILAQLNISLSRNSGVAPNTYSVYGYVADGLVSQGSGDWDSGSGNLLGTFIVTSEPVGTAFGVDVTEFLNASLLAGADFVGFNVRRSAGPNNSEFEWLGTIGNTATVTGYSGPFPTLEVTSVPLPAAAWLLLSGLGGLGFVGRRRAFTRLF